MFIDKVTLKNVRGFRNLEFSLDRGSGSYAGWTVFTGDNGSGKSTLLKAIAVALTGKDTARALQPSFHRWIRDGEHEASIELQLVRSADDDSLSGEGKAPSKEFPACVSLKNGSKEPHVEITIPTGKPKNYSTPQRTIWSLDAKGWFSCGYGPFRRVFGASPEATRQMVAPATERFVTMFQEAASLAEVDQWLRNLSHKDLEGKGEEGRQLAVLIEILRDDLMPNQITVDRVDSDGLWLKDRSGLQLAWSEMSDGYRAALALLADILRHLINAYGVSGLTGRGADGKLFVKRSGVVLIDEIDAHLHPEWQREIGFWLKRHFPKIQFLVTTHSPIICQAADENGLFVLPEPGSGDEPHALTPDEYRIVIVSRPDTILLTPAFGLQNTRSPRAVEGRAEYAKLMAKQRAGGRLTKEEQGQADQLQLFAVTGEEP
jgi:energy-coupling factor transporter ATP-binding protein EcfA2